ncbi:hypothetical protein GCM10023321_17270 [Pseudonocardia eucalypti]|uniref:Uncharacterized protein n=1 Tax=Pseudonocardia eucalypti TaxID=648755 RepID=A0ABP9PVL8_9PSEU|nr:hypothetical protein [Pseudonocardia eucalypti]
MVRPALCRARNFRRLAISALVAGLAVVLQLGVVDVSPARLLAAASAPVGGHGAGAMAVRPVSAAVPLVPAQDGADGGGGSGGGGCGSDGSPCGSGSDNNDSSAGSSGGTSDRKPEEESNADGSKPTSEPNGGQGSSAPTTESAADGSRQTETAAPVADGAKRTETPAPVADGARPTETPAPVADGAKQTETPVPGADGARTTEPAAPAADGSRPTESAAPVADGARPTEAPAPGAPADGARPTPTAAPVADGVKRDEPVAPGDGAKTTPAPAPIDGARPNETALPAAPVDGARPSGAPAAPGVQPPPSPGAVPIAQECEGAENCPNPVTGIPPYEQGTSAVCADGSGSKAGCDSSSAGSTALEVSHLILDAASFVPGPVGIAASVINAGAYLAEGKEGEATFAMMGVVPGGKIAGKLLKGADEVVDGAKVARFITTPAGVTIDRQAVRAAVSPQKQARHVLGTTPAGRTVSYFNTTDDAQKVLDAFHNGSAEVMGVTKAGHVKVKFDGVTGYNNNPGSGYINQPTNTFMIKGTSSPSVVPISP